jgi:hypothetical protein
VPEGGDNRANWGKFSLEIILKQFAVMTNQTHMAMTTLLQLLKKYRPETYYDLLPATGKQLLHIDGMDFDGNSSELPKPKLIENGKYLHYGLELALSGNSPGVYHRHALMTEFAKLYKSKVEVVPHPIRKKVFFFRPYF